MNNLLSWCNNLKQAWFEKDFDRMKQIFIKTEYYESPFTKPTTDINKILEYWQEIKNQQISKLEITPLLSKDLEHILNWQLDYIDKNTNEVERLDGIFLVKFNQNSECIYFKQWWTEE